MCSPSVSLRCLSPSDPPVCVPSLDATVVNRYGEFAWLLARASIYRAFQSYSISRRVLDHQHHSEVRHCLSCIQGNSVPRYSCRACFLCPHTNLQLTLLAEDQDLVFEPWQARDRCRLQGDNVSEHRPERKEIAETCPLSLPTKPTPPCSSPKALPFMLRSPTRTYFGHRTIPQLAPNTTTSSLFGRRLKNLCPFSPFNKQSCKPRSSTPLRMN
jgi:hypothetical protein